MASNGVPAQREEDEDDYLTMTFEDSSAAQKESLTQKKKRLAREAEVRGRPKSRHELATEEKSRREEALKKTQLDSTNKGFKMMAALGYKAGTALGVARDGTSDGEHDDRLLEPIGLEIKEDRGGIGADAEKKRKFREEAAAAETDLKKRKVDEGDFRERQQREREEKRKEGQIIGAMKVCERLEEDCDNSDTAKPRGTKPLHSFNVLWRGLVKERLLKERERRMRYDLHQSLSRRAAYDDVDEDEDDKLALSKNPETEEVDVDLDQDDEELDEFEALPVFEKLEKLITYLRERWHYCFWCKHQYPDESMDGCPGRSEEDHD